MKRFILLSEKQLFFKLLCFSAGVCVCFLLLGVQAYGETGEGNELVSLTVDDMPLAEVLEKLSKSTGYEFSVSEEWLDYPISASFDSIPLHRVLKRMLADLSSAVIYGSDKKIKIIIYNDVSEVQEVSQKPKAKESPKKKKSRQQAAIETRPSPSDSERSEDSEGSNSIQDALDEYQQTVETAEENSTESQPEEPADEEQSAGTAESGTSGQRETENSDRAEAGESN